MNESHEVTNSASQEEIHLPEEMRQQTERMIKDAFGLMRDHVKEMASELAEFDKMRTEVQENIRRGGRRTSGRIL